MVTLFHTEDVAHANRHGSNILDLFAGPGGWSHALTEFGLTETGIKYDPRACSTRRAAGHLTIETSVTDTNPNEYNAHRGLIASPPCQTFSTAGNRAGHKIIDTLRINIELGHFDDRPSTDERSWLPLEVGRYVEVLWPEWVALEQVPGALPLWESYAAWLDGNGYNVWYGIINSADYGVPQTRKRAVLIASANHAVTKPVATHDRTGANGLPTWVTLADALGDTSRQMQWAVNTGRAWNQQRGGAQVVQCGTNPAPTLTTKSGSQWNIGDGTRGPHTRRLSIADALTIQSFPAGYPVQGTIGERFTQIGNAVPPAMAAAVLRQVI